MQHARDTLRPRGTRHVLGKKLTPACEIALRFSSTYWSRQLLSAGLLRTRRYRFTSYDKCFVGAQFVSWLVDTGRVGSRQEGAFLGELLRLNNVLHHVVDAHKFEDGDLFYRMTADDSAETAASRLPVAELVVSRDHALAGWFFKQGHVFLNRRYFVLDGDHRRLYVYTNDVAGSPRYYISLVKGCRLSASVALPPPSNHAAVLAASAANDAAAADDDDTGGGVLLRGWGAPKPAPAAAATTTNATPAASVAAASTPAPAPAPPSAPHVLRGTIAGDAPVAAPPSVVPRQTAAMYPTSGGAGTGTGAGGGTGAGAGGGKAASARSDDTELRLPVEHSVWSEDEDSDGGSRGDNRDADPELDSRGAKAHLIHLVSPEAEIYACVVLVCGCVAVWLQGHSICGCGCALYGCVRSAHASGVQRYDVQVCHDGAAAEALVACSG